MRICDALGAIHSRGLIHYDIKPENIILIPCYPPDSDPSTPSRDRRGGSEPGCPSGFDVKILDFGLSDEDTTPLGTRVRGTIPYIAPELMDASSADSRCDLFSLGVTIAYAVTGRFPFPGSRPERWIDAARKGRTVDLSRLRPDMPRGLALLVEELLKPSPDLRPATAFEALARLEEIGGFHIPSGKKIQRRSFPRVGWERELSVFRTEIESLKRGEAGRCLIVLEGDSGHFLDRFLDEVEVMARGEGIRVLTGSSRLPRRYPYGPFAEISKKLAQEVDLSSPRFERFSNVLSTFSPVEVVPESIKKAALPVLKPKQEIYRFLDLTTRFFLEAARDAPLVLCIRDLHLAGKESFELLRSLTRNIQLRLLRREGNAPDLEPTRLLIVGTFRESKVEGEGEAIGTASADVLGELLSEPHTERVRLRSLSLDRIPDWIQERTPGLRLEGDLIRRLHEKSAGSPWLVDEFVRRAAGKPDNAETSPAKANGIADSQVLLRLPRKAEDAAFERVEALSPPERRILEILSAAHGSLAIRELEAVEELGNEDRPHEPDLAARVETLSEQGFLELREETGGALAHMCHLALASQIYRQMREDLRISVHRRIALALMERLAGAGPGRAPEDIAFHARLGGLNGLYFKQALIAAEKLCEARACEAATQLYEEILERLGTGAVLEMGSTALPVDPDLLRRQVNERLAAVYLGRGHYQRALEKLTFLSATHELLPDSRDLAQVYRTMAEVYQQNGEQANALYFLEKSLKLCLSKIAELPSPERRPSPVPEKMTEECLLTLLALARYHLGREALEESERVLKDCLERAGASSIHRESTCRAHALMADIESRRGNHARALSENLEALRLAEEDGALPLRLETLSGVGWSYLSRGEYDRAAAYFERGIEVSQELESKFDTASLLSSLGTLHHNRADHQKALECFTRSLALNTQIGDLKGIANSHNNLGIVHRLKDDLAQASDCYKRAIDLFSRINDQSGMAAGMNNLSSILELDGKYNEALDYSFRALDKRKKSRSRSGMAFSYYRIGKIYQSKGEIDKAVTYAEKSLQIRVELGEKLGIAYSRLQIAELYLSQGKYSESLQLCELGLKDFQDLDNEVGVLLARETLARVLLRLGDLDGAREILNQVLERSREREQPLLTGSCLLHLGRIAAEIGDSRGAEDLLSGAEKLFRSHQNKREIADVLLDVCALNIEEERFEEGSAHLEEAYSILEELGVRDLVPLYFLLRGRLACMETPGADTDAARKFLERGLVEARELNLPDLQWRLHFHIGLLDARRGDPKLARIHFQEAKEMLQDACATLPQRLRETFYRAKERKEPEKAMAAASLQAMAQPTPHKKGDTDSWKVAVPPPRRGSGADDILLLHQETLKLHQIASAMGNEKDLQKLLESIMDAVLELVDAERGFIILKNDESGNTPALQGDARTILVARNLDREGILEPEGKVSDSISREVLLSGKPVLARNALSEPRFLSSKSVRDLRLRSLVCVPLRFRNEILGIIYLDNRHRRDAFRPHDLDLLQAFADQAAVAVKNAQLIEENVKRTNELIEANRKTESFNEKLRRTVDERNAQLAMAREDLRNRQSQLETRYRFQNIVGKSEAIQEIFFLLERVSATQLPVLLEGESGTGKELIAHAIHFNSRQKQARFVSQNCGALTESLLETELFGHTRGAFTGAISDKMGLFELANNGTLFLDEVGDMSLGMQQKLLRVLQEGEIRRVGGKETVRVNVRIISASNKNLLDLVGQGKFREDLYYRINGIRIRMPGLRDRKEDIPLLVEHFLELAHKPGEPVRRFQGAAMRALMERDWPGNVRELRHFLERTLLIAPESEIREEDLLFDAPRPLKANSTERTADPALGDGEDARRAQNPPLPSRPIPGLANPSLRDARSSFEQGFLVQCLRTSRGNVSAAARTCRISRESFYRLLRKYGVEPREARDRTGGDRTRG